MLWSLIRQFHSAIIQFTYREANGVADLLAKEGAASSVSLSHIRLFHLCPTSVRSILAHDLSMIGSFRTFFV